MYDVNTINKDAGSYITIKVNFRKRNIIRGKGEHYIIIKRQIL